jgi:DNA replication protein DnaC
MEVLRKKAEAVKQVGPERLAALIESLRTKVVRSDEEIRADDEAREARKRQARIIEFWSRSGVEKKYRDVPREPVWVTLPEDTRERYRAAFNELTALETVQGGALVAMVGARGPGKTWMASCLVKRFCAAARHAIYANTLGFFMDLRATYGDRGIGTERDVKARYMRPEFLVLDAVEEKSDSSTSQQQMLTHLLSARLDAEKLTLIVSNDDGSTLPDRIGPSLADRLNDGGGIIVCNWPSLRGRIGRIGAAP